MEGSTDFFINLIQNSRIIYDKSLKDFKNTRKKDQAWAVIANQSRMTIDAAKKRYNSLRQKYSREKRSLEVKRRNKEVAHKNWVFYDRLNFLDSFVQPRTTYTNDTGFEEGQDEEIFDEHTGECTVHPSRNNDIDVDVDDDIGMNELDNLLGATQESHIVDEPLYIPEDTDIIVSDYTGEVSSIRYMSQSARNGEFLNVDEHVSDTAAPDVTNNDHEHVSDTAAPDVTNNDHEQSMDEMDPDFMSPHPSTSSSHRNVIIVVPPSHDLATGNTSCTPQSNANNTTLRPLIIGNRHPLSSQKSDETQNSSKLKLPIRLDAPVRNNVSSQNKIRSSAGSNRTTTPASSHKTAQQPTTTTTSKEKSIEAIRNKMDSCLNAINNKVMDKAQRSPHAPFLAYLGTKLQDVPKEKISDLEREILDLVKFHSN